MSGEVQALQGRQTLLSGFNFAGTGKTELMRTQTWNQRPTTSTPQTTRSFASTQPRSPLGRTVPMSARRHNEHQIVGRRNNPSSTDSFYAMPDGVRSNEHNFRNTQLDRLSGVKTRNLVSSHAKRTKKTIQEVRKDMQKNP